MARKTGGFRDNRAKRGTNVKGNLRPGIYVEDPQVTLTRNVNRLIEKWQRNGVTISSFCRQAGVSEAILLRIRKGQACPEPGTLMKIASTFGVPIEVLFRR